MLDLVVFILSVILFGFLAIKNTRLKNQNMYLIMVLDQAIKDIELIRSRVNGDTATEKEHLISFLNETRDISYKYIEDVHKSLLEFEIEIGPELISPDENSINKINTAFKKLKKIYPEDIPND
jgi:hypothetical protein